MALRRRVWISTFALAACVNPAAADFAAGLAAYQKGDYTTAVKEWRPEAEQGDAPTQFNLGLLYYDGKGVPQDFEQAAKWFARSAEQDYVTAQKNLGEMYAVGKGVKRDYVQAYKWLNICASKGDAICAEHRDTVAKNLKASKLAAAQRLSSEWKPTKEPAKQ